MTVFAVAVSALAGGVQFPSKVSAKAFSPHHKWWVVCSSREVSQFESPHVLVLMNKAASFELRHFDRGCDVLWSPDGSHLAITDWLGSNLSDVFVYSPLHPTEGRSLRDTFPSGTIPESELRGHCYFEATKWIDAQHLRVRVFGHVDAADGREFEHRYVFDLRSRSFRQVGKKMPNQPHSANSRPAANVRVTGSFCLITMEQQSLR